MPNDHDVIIIGTGAGGGTLASAANSRARRRLYQLAETSANPSRLSKRSVPILPRELGKERNLAAS